MVATMNPLASAESAVSVDSASPVLYRVVEKNRETAASVTLTLEAQEAAVAAPAAGQFNMLWVRGLGEVPISTSSIVAPGVLVHTIRDVGPVTHSLCATPRGGIVGVRGPFGRGWDVESAKGHDLVIVAGGIGLAPLRPVVQAVLADRDAFGAVMLVVGARAVAELVFRDELDGWWRDRSIIVRTIVDKPDSTWTGNVGIVTKELDRIDVDPQRATAMVCGPEVMMRFVGARLIDSGMDSGQILVSLERNMQCGMGLCGHCQVGGIFVCRDGPVVTWDVARPLMEVRER